MTVTEERLDHIEQKLDNLQNKFAEITIWATIGKMSVGGILGGVATLAIVIIERSLHL